MVYFAEICQASRARWAARHVEGQRAENANNQLNGGKDLADNWYRSRAFSSETSRKLWKLYEDGKS